MSARAGFRQSDAERLIAAVQAKGLPVFEVIYKEGEVRVLTAPGPSPEGASPLQEWRSKRGPRAA